MCILGSLDLAPSQRAISASFTEDDELLRPMAADFAAEFRVLPSGFLSFFLVVALRPLLILL